MSAIDISNDLGLGAVVLLTCNILLGLLISVRYSPVKNWPRRKINLFGLHNWTGYTALCVAVLHPVVLLFSRTAGFRWTDVVWPLRAPAQPVINSLGAAALYGLMVVVGTSYFRVELGRRRWKALHYTAYFSAALFFAHGLFSDPQLKGRRPDFLDGEKLLVEVCLVVVMAAVGWRVRYGMGRRARA